MSKGHIEAQRRSCTLRSREAGGQHRAKGIEALVRFLLYTPGLRSTQGRALPGEGAKGAMG